MITTTLLAGLLAAAAATGTSSDDEATGKWTLTHAKVGAFGGFFDGKGVRTDSGGAALIEGTVTPRLRTGDWKFDVPVRLHHFQTFGASLSETYGSVYAGAENRLSKGLRLGASLGLSGARRPHWPDLYQPITSPSGPLGLNSTDRYSYLAWHVRLNLAATPFARNHLRLTYEYVHFGYTRDPNFDAARPMHLTPRDNGQHLVGVSWRVLGDGYSVAAHLDYGHRYDEVYLSRNAVTGTTNFYTTPYQDLARVEPSVEVRTKRLGDRLDVTLQYGYQIQTDGYQGYYSYTGHHPRLAVEYAFTDRLSARVKGEVWWREYGPDSKAAGLQAGQPNTLENGSRLYDRKGAVGATVSYALTNKLSATLRGDWVRRSTNYPDYVPNVYPATRQYDIEWSYVNTQVLAGVELKL